MKIIKSTTHRAELSDDGILKIFLLKGKKIQETSFNGNNVKTVVEHTAKKGAPLLRNLLVAMDNLPVCCAAFATNGDFHIDCEVGMQRWKGYTTTTDMQKKLKEYNFETKDIKFIIKFCKNTEHLSLARVS